MIVSHSGQGQGAVLAQRAMRPNKTGKTGGRPAVKSGLAPALLLCALAAGPAVLATEAADAARLRLIVATCQTCHSEAQDAATLPRLEGMAPEALRALLEAYKTGKAPATIMDRIAKGLTAEEIAGISILFGAGEE